MCTLGCANGCIAYEAEHCDGCKIRAAGYALVFILLSAVAVVSAPLLVDCSSAVKQDELPLHVGS